MLYSQSPPLADDEAAEESSPRAYPRDAEPQFGRRPVRAPIHDYPPRRSIGRRMFRSMMRFVILVGIGVGGTLGWQAYGDMGKGMLAAYAPEQAWLLSYLPSTKPPAAVAAAPSPALQLEPLAANLASSVEYVRRSVEQLALKQDQMNRSIAALQAADEDIRQRVSSPPSAAPQPVAAVPPPPRPAPPKPQPAPGAPTSGAPRPAASAAPVSILPR